MTDNERLAELLFPNISWTPQQYEEQYPARQLPEGARVTRFSPSPTGYLHIGGLFAAMTARLTAKATSGVFFLRIEDTDKKREVEGGVTAPALLLSVLRRMRESPGSARRAAYTAPTSKVSAGKFINASQRSWFARVLPIPVSARRRN